MDTIHLVVDLRNYAEMQELQLENLNLKAMVKQLDQEIRIWTHYAVELQEAND